METNWKTQLDKTLKMGRMVQVAGVISILVYAVLLALLLHIRFPAAMPASQAEVMRMFCFTASLFAMLAVPLLQRLLLRTTGEKSIEKLLPRLQHACIVTMALSELPAVLGLLLFLTSGNVRDALVMMGFSMILMIGRFPTEAKWLAWLRLTVGDQNFPATPARDESRRDSF